MMELLTNRYGTKSFLGGSHILQDLLQIRIQSNESARTYCDRFKVQVDEVIESGMDVNASLQVYLFLYSLDARFDSFVQFQTHIFQNGTPITELTLQTLFTAIMQKEIRSISSNTDTALYTNTHRQQCSSNSNSSESTVTCMYCHKRNHTENVCRKKRADTANSNRSDSTTSNEQSTSERSGTSSNRNSNSCGRSSSGPPAMFGSTPQLSMVVSKVSVALHSFASTPSPEWILDPGASNH
ncbi:hypothetical protein AeRB84_004352 [Aphanomyces euteiches]|nr:hypothetical protein AeRB84_004352 [Aphanomyces euteiches]